MLGAYCLGYAVELQVWLLSEHEYWYHQGKIFDYRFIDIDRIRLVFLEKTGRQNVAFDTGFVVHAVQWLTPYIVSYCMKFGLQHEQEARLVTEKPFFLPCVCLFAWQYIFCLHDKKCNEQP